MRTAGLLAAAVLLAGCGLPLEAGVREPGRVAAELVEEVDTQVVYPPPRPDAGPREIVAGFLEAQSSAGEQHAVAREYLHPDVRADWDDTRGVEVYAGRSVALRDETTVAVTFDVVAQIAPDGEWSLRQDTREEVYRLRHDEQGQLRLVDVPPGLWLSRYGVARSYRPRDVLFVSRSARRPGAASLVPDRVFLPVGAELADAVVRRLLAGPSASLRGAVDTGFPAGTELLHPVTTSDGVVTVDLSAPAGTATARQRAQLSAQLVWTLDGTGQAFNGVRVLVEGRPLEVDGAGQVQQRTDWAAADPAAPMARTPALYVEDGRLRRLNASLTPSEATDGRLPVDAAVASPGTGRLALLTRTDAGAELRTGPPAGPFALVTVRPQLSSMSWGSGDEGLWLVSAGEVLLVPGGTGVSAEPVPFAAPPEAGPLSVLKVSRDDARVAAVLGEGRDRRLYVGRVERTGSGIRLAGLRAVAPEVTDVADVTWESGTSLVVLGQLGTPNRLPVRVAVDGSAVEPVRTLGLDGEPETVTAAPGRPLVVGAQLSGQPVLLVQDGGLFRLQEGQGRAPAYPG